MRCVRPLLLAVTLGILSVASAQAADLDSPYFEGRAPAVEPLQEFGTGWYLRGDIAAARDKSPTLAPDLSFLNKGTQNSWSTGLGMGYQFNSWFRTDLTLDFRKTLKSSGNAATVVCPYTAATMVDPNTNTAIGVLYNTNDTCTPKQNASISSQAVMLNGYFDLGTWASVTPYVGAGVGVSSILSKGAVRYFKTSDQSAYAADLSISGVPPVWVDINGNQINPQPNIAFAKQNWDRQVRNRDFGLAWALMAGFGYDLNQHAKLDVGYRYINMGSYSTTSLAGVKSTATMSAHELRAGIRYMID